MQISYLQNLEYQMILMCVFLTFSRGQIYADVETLLFYHITKYRVTQKEKQFLHFKTLEKLIKKVWQLYSSLMELKYHTGKDLCCWSRGKYGSFKCN
jgi:hypothetical protein